MEYVLILVLIILGFLFTRNLFNMAFSMENYNIHKKRLKQLQYGSKKQDAEVSELINSFTKPVINHVFSRFKPQNLEQLDVNLRFAKWDKYFSPVQFRAFSLTLKVIAVVVFLLLNKASMVIALVWAVLLFAGIDVLFKNSISNRRDKLIADFPDFIRITEGYMSANIPLSQAVSECIKYVGEEWKPILKKFVIECDLKSVTDALDGLKTDVDLFEVREFVALVKLSLEQGGDVRDSFGAQADKIREMQMDMIAIKIGKRKMMGTFIQAPLLLCNILVFGLPTLYAMTTLSSM